MFVMIIFFFVIQWIFNVVYVLFQKFLMVVGLVFVMGFVGLQIGYFGMFEGLCFLMFLVVVLVIEEVFVELFVELLVEVQFVLLLLCMSGVLNYVF